MKILLLDIETSPNTAHVWGLFQQNVSLDQIVDSGYTLSWAAKWYGEKGVMFSSLHNDKPSVMLKKIHKLIEEADVVVHYNGTKFDMPVLNKEFILAGMAPPSPVKQVDLLKTVRRQFRFTSNKLDYVSQSLGIGAKTQHKGHKLWVGCMEGDPACWKVMEKYNKQDVVLLEKLYDRLLPWIKGHPSYGVYHERSFICPNCGSSDIQHRGYSYTGSGKYQRYQCNHCGKWSRERTTCVDKDVAKGILVHDNGG